VLVLAAGILVVCAFGVLNCDQLTFPATGFGLDVYLRAVCEGDPHVITQLGYLVRHLLDKNRAGERPAASGQALKSGGKPGLAIRNTVARPHKHDQIQLMNRIT
jgi:hypothetical protein